MHLTLHLTDRCDFACKYCYAKHGDQDMSFETATAAIEKCAVEPNCGIIFFGGEPLLRQDLIWELIDWCERVRPHHYHYKVTTNGLGIDEAFLERAERNRLHVALSHDGVREAHDLMRRRAGGGPSFELLSPKLKALLARMPYAPVMTTVCPETVGRFADSARWLADQGARYLICSLNYAGAWDDATLKVLKKQYLLLEEWHYGNYRARRKIYFSPFDKRIASHIFPERGCSCRLGMRQISVGPSGTLYPCVQFVGAPGYEIGDVANGIDEARRQRLYAMNEEDKPECAGCALAGRCHNKCGCLNFQTTGDIRKLPAVLCEHERMVFPIADRLAGRLYRHGDPLFLRRHYDSAFPVLSFLEDLANS